MKKVLLLNGSPRKNWNTHQLLEAAEAGAREAGAETRLVHLFDLDFTDCKSCFACKRKGSKTGGVCALRDGLREVLEYAWDCDAIILGYPIYYGNMTAPALAFKNRLLFPVMSYENDPETGKFKSELNKPKNVGLIVSGNASEEGLAGAGGDRFRQEAWQMNWVLGGSGDVVFAAETYQFSDYSKYKASMFDDKARAERREKQFPIDLANARDMGRRLAS